MVTIPGVAQFLALLFVLIPAFSAGAPPEPYASALLMLAGLLLLFFRPATPVPRPFAYAAGALALGCSLAFLPVDWFGRAEWRTTFESFGNATLGALATPQPWHTLLGMGMLLAGICFGLFLLCQPVNGQTHEGLAGGFTLGVAAYAALSIYAVSSGWHHPWDTVGTFGFLPNRNHVGTLLAMGAVAGLGPFWNYLERRHWVQAVTLGAAITLIAFASLNYSESRAACGLLFGGFFLWLAGVFHRNIDRRAAVSALILILFALGVFATSRTPAMQRLKQPAPSPALFDTERAPGQPPPNLASVPLEFRLLLYRDTCRMIAEQPLTGIGLGNYRYLSQQYREASLSQSLAIHSDNSWLLLAAEAGLPTALAAAALVVLAFLRLRGCRRHPSWSVRWASAAAVALFVGHCAVDVPAHRAATLLPALFLAGLAFRQLPATRPSRPTPSRKASYAFFAAAGAALLVAGAWMGGWLPSTQAKTLPTDEIEKAPEWIYTLHQHRHTEEAITLAQNILTRTPLSAGLYFQWGAMELTFEGTEKTVDNLFAIERALEPHFITTPLRQAVVWMNVDPERSLRLFADAMERAHQQDRCGGGHYASNTFDAILQNTAKTPELSDKLYPLTDNRPDLLLLWGNAASPSAFRLVLHKILARDPSLAQWEPGGQLKLLRLWSSKGDRTELQNLLHVRPSLQNAAWPILAGELARSQQYEQAWRIADAQLHLNTFDFYREEAPSGRLRAAYEENKTAIAAERLAKALFKEGDFEGVLQFTAKARTANALSPNLSRVASVAATRLARWPDAWAHLVDLVRAKNPELLPE